MKWNKINLVAALVLLEMKQILFVCRDKVISGQDQDTNHLAAG